MVSKCENGTAQEAGAESATATAVPVYGTEITPAVFVNAYEEDLGALKISKRMAEGQTSTETFEFTVVFVGDKAAAMAGQSYPYTIGSTTGSYTAEASEGGSRITGIQLSAGQSVIISGLPVGVGYTVTETDKPHYTAVSDPNPATGTVAAGETPETEIVFTNTFEDQDEVVYTVKKTFINGDLSQKTFEYLFAQIVGIPSSGAAQIYTGNNKKVEATYNRSTDATGTVIFDTITFDQNDVGKTFYFQIVERVPDGLDENGIKDLIRYDLTKHYFSVEVKLENNELVLEKHAYTQGDGETTALFTNEQLGRLTVTKTFAGTAKLTEDQKKAITFSITGPEGFTAITGKTLGSTESPAFVKDENGVYTLTLENIPLGPYTVKETNDTVEGYNHTYSICVDGGAASAAGRKNR